MLVRMKPMAVQAIQWGSDKDQDKLNGIVTECSPDTFCQCYCGHPASKHGRRLSDDEFVCPGDWVIIEPNGSTVIRTPEEFERYYETFEK